MSHTVLHVATFAHLCLGTLQFAHIWMSASANQWQISLCTWQRVSWPYPWHQRSRIHLPSATSCLLLSFVSCCTITGCRERLTLIVQLTLLIQERKNKSKKKLLTQHSCRGLRTYWSRINNRTALSSTLWALPASTSSSWCSFCPFWKALPTS